MIAGTGDVVHCRLRGGNAHTGRGAAGFVTETFNRVRAAGATGPLTLRADSGFYSGAITAASRRAGVPYSITAKLKKRGTRRSPFSPRRRGRQSHTSVTAPMSRRPHIGLSDPKPHTFASSCAASTHPRIATRVARRLRLPRVHHRPHRLDRRTRSRPPPTRCHRRHHPRPQIRCRTQPPPIRAVRRKRRTAWPQRDRPQPRPLDQPPRARRNTHHHRHPAPPIPTNTRTHDPLRPDGLHLPQHRPWALKFNTSLARLRAIAVVT